MQSPSKLSLDASRGQRGNHRLELDKASADEMREFLHDMNALHPQQVMGVGKPGGLASGMILATLSTVVLMLALTIGPYLWATKAGKGDKAPVAAAAKTEAAESGEKAEKTAPAARTQAGTNAPAGENPSAKSPDASQVGASQPQVSKSTLERLGVDEVKNSDPNVNPLDSKLDDLLDKTK